MKLLIVEEDANFHLLLQRFLKRSGYLCESAHDLREAYKKVVSHEYDCILLDVAISGGEGSKLLRLLRENKSEVGVIIISESDVVADKVELLNNGADDYLTRPFELVELEARIRAIIRRRNGILNREVQLGEITIMLDSRDVKVNGKSLQLTRKEFDILVFLARNKARVITKDSIAEHLWGDYMDDAPTFDFIYAHIKNLRKKLTEAQVGDYLKTVYGVGYQFVIP
jgi:DNA-binding response OmpR family regulator